MERSIASSVSGNSRNFTAPSTMTTQAKIRVSDAVDATKSDESDAVFSIVDLPSPVTLLTPNSGQIWVAGTTQDINYTSSANVNIKRCL